VRYKERDSALPPKDLSMILLVLLLVLALIFGIGAVIKGVIWLAIVGFLAFVVLTAAAIGASRRPSRNRV
jgi:purine-cytosine permease-like protein